MKGFDPLGTRHITELVLEYGELSTREQLSEEEENRMADILILATNDPILDFWLSEIDHCLGHHLGLLDEEHRNYYREQKAWLAKYAVTHLSDHTVCERARNFSIENDDLNAIIEAIPHNFLNSSREKG